MIWWQALLWALSGAGMLGIGAIIGGAIAVAGKNESKEETKEEEHNDE